MRVAYDQTAFLLQEYGGLTRYFCRLAQALQDEPGVEARIVAPLHYNVHLAQVGPPVWRGLRAPRLPKTRRLVFAASRLLARRELLRFRPDILHHSYYDPGAFAPRGARRVVTVLDMIHERFPDSFDPGDPASEAKRRVVAAADHVICISERTRRDLVELFGTPEAKTSVVHLAADPPGPAPAEPFSAGGRPYLLFVGLRGGYKNFAGLLRAIAVSPRLRGNFALRCFGGGPFTAEERALIAELGLDPARVTQEGGDDGRLDALYRGAAVFVYPSLYEGFGIPPLEAMARGCPVICCDASSLPEVAGDAAEYFAPGDPDALRLALERLVDDPGRRDALVARGRARAAGFSWTRCARGTLAVYRTLV